MVWGNDCLCFKFGYPGNKLIAAVANEEYDVGRYRIVNWHLAVERVGACSACLFSQMESQGAHAQRGLH